MTKLESAYLFHRVNTGGNAAAIVGYLYDIVLFEYHIYPVTVPGKGFVYGVVHNFVYQMMEAVDAGGANIHARSFADRFKTFKYLYACC